MERYWVIGGDYDGPHFGAVQPGTEQVKGPFEDQGRALTEWRRLTFCDKGGATTRYSIAAEGRRG